MSVKQIKSVVLESKYNEAQQRIKELEQELALMKAIRPSQQELDDREAECDKLKKAQKFNHDNLMIVEKDRQKCRDEVVRLQNWITKNGGG